MTDEIIDDNGAGAGAGADTQQAKPWFDGAPDEVVGFLQNKGWTEDPLKAVSAYQNLEKFHGVPAEQLLKLPKDLNDTAALNDVFKRLGAPESAEKYEVTLPEGLTVDETRLGAIKQAAHNAGLLPHQLSALVKADADHVLTMQQQAAQEREQKAQIEEQNLRREWGNKAEERFELARRFLRSNVPNGMDQADLIDKIESAIGLEATMKLFANAADKVGVREHAIHDSGGDTAFGYTPEQAKHDKARLLDDIQSDNERLARYNTGKGADYDKVLRLNKIITNS